MRWVEGLESSVGPQLAEPMGSPECRAEAEAGVRGPESSLVQLREALTSTACSLTPALVGRRASAPEALCCWEASNGLPVFLGLPPDGQGVRTHVPSQGVQGCCSEQMWS